jgi:RNA polymerase sigma factor (TIGR02999 family)
LDNSFAAQFSDSYERILAMARSRLAREHAPISTVTLAHELFLSLSDRKDLHFASEAQFLAYSSRAMRSLLVDLARERLAKKRAVELLPLTLGRDVPDMGGTPEQLVALDDALNQLANVDARLVRVAELRIIMGMEIAAVAQVLGLSEPTIKRDWQRAKAYLSEALGAAG